MSHLQENIKPYSKAIVKLLKGTVEKKDKIWAETMHYRNEIQDYISQIGLELIIKEEDGYAFIKQFEIDNEGNTIGLVSRRQVGFETSIVLVILRQIIEDFESNPIESISEKFIQHSELVEEIEFFLTEKYNHVQFLKGLDGYIKKVIDLGYLKVVPSNEIDPKYVIHKIIKEKITLDTLKEFKEKLQKYVESI